MQKGLRVITLQGAIKKIPILLSQYWKNEWLDDTIIISYFGGSNNIFADCRRWEWSKFWKVWIIISFTQNLTKGEISPLKSKISYDNGKEIPE